MLLTLLRSRLLTVLVWLALVGTLFAWWLVRQADDLTLPTLLSYGPRWICVVPALVLLPTAFFRRSRAIPLLAALCISAGPLMQFELPSLSGADSAPDAALTLLTMNTGLELESGTLTNLLREHRVDVAALQEWRGADNKPPQVPGYTTACEGGLCFLSRLPMRTAGSLDRSRIGGYHGMAMRATVETSGGEVSIANVHLETVREGIEAVLERESNALRELSGNIRFRELESRVVSAWVGESKGPLLVAGDFNLPTDSAIFRAHWARWSSAFEEAGLGYGWTKFTRWWGIRIDHILFDQAEWQVVDAHVGEDVGSDHRPVIARMRRK